MRKMLEGKSELEKVGVAMPDCKTQEVRVFPLK